MANIQPELTLEEICNLPFSSPEAAAEFQDFLDEMQQLAASLPPEAEPTEETTDEQ